MKGKCVSVFLILLLCNVLQSQDSLFISFLPTIELEVKDSLPKIEMLKAYVNSFQLWCKDELVWEGGKNHFLLDIEKPESLLLGFSLPKKLKYDAIQFMLGVDSTIQAGGVMGGDLDPLKGMYWTWNTGYINFKLEGTSPESNERNHGFQYHLGGYQAPYPSNQIIRLAVAKKAQLIIKINPFLFLEQVDIAEEATLMSPGKRAQELSILATEIFSIDE